MLNLFETFLYLSIFIPWRAIASPISQNKCISPISWSPCADDPRFDCASFDVPLDYAYPQNRTATLALARLKSQCPNSKGTILTNPGGPGSSGVDFLITRAGDLISNVTNGEFDILSWDPRGVNHSRPLITCGLSTEESFDDFFANSVFENGIEVRDSLIVEAGQKCVEANDFLQFVGTTSTVRDMVSIWDCIDQSDKLNYWGFSYGTIIGSYFVNMFPERVGRVILDGVVDAVSWATEPTIAQSSSTLNDAEKALLGFADSCAQAGPANCSIAQVIPTGPEIFSELETAYNLTKLGFNNVTSFEGRNFLWELMFTPIAWSSVGVPEIEFFESVLESEASALNTTTKRRRRSLPTCEEEIPASSDTIIDPTVAAFVSELAITCVDSIDQPEITTQLLFESLVNVTQQISPIFGEVLVAQPPAFCHRFPTRAVERFTGPFNHTLAFPVLVIENTADPVTPFQNAQKIANLLGNSARLVQQDGFGHTSIAMNSDCTQSIVRDYFFTGALPTSGVVCPTDQALFPPNITVASVNAL